MDYVGCNGTEYGLRMCRYFVHDDGCTHRDDVGIQCQPGLLSLILNSVIVCNIST